MAEFIQNNPNFKKDILNLEIITNNRDNALFRYLIPSLENIQGFKDICTISINYNGSMSEDDIKKANEEISKFGFNIYWAYTKYDFNKNQHAVLRIRKDCDDIKTPKSPYVLLVDDDFEFLPGYESNLLVALNCLKDHKDIGMISFDRGKNNQYFSVYNSAYTDEHEAHPVRHNSMIGLLGGLVLQRQGKQNIYIKEVQDLWGGGEERVLHFTMLWRGLKTYRISNSNYLHEQHWQHNEQICGQHIYGWRWSENDEGCIAWWIERVKKGEITTEAMQNMPEFDTYKNDIYRYDQPNDELLKRLVK